MPEAFNSHVDKSDRAIRSAVDSLVELTGPHDAHVPLAGDPGAGGHGLPTHFKNPNLFFR